MTSAEHQYLESLNDEFFIEIIAKKLKVPRTTFRVRIVYITPACVAGDNYVAKIFRARIQIEMVCDKTTQSVSVILKVLLSTMEAMKEFNVFPREMKVYQEIIPAFEELYKEAGMGISFGPSCLKCESTPYEVIVLDDLTAEGYRMVNRLESLDVQHLRIVLTKLAQFHAVSMIYYEKEQPKDVDFLRNMENFKPEMIEFFKTMQTNMIQTFIDVLETTDFGHKYLHKLNKWKDNAFEMFGEMSKPSVSGMLVLNHGDLWINNHMYLYDGDDKPVETSLIDFQGPYWGTPAYDLHYLFISSVKTEVLINQYDELVQFYHASLEKHLQILEYTKPIPSLKQLHGDLLDRGQFAGLCTANILAIICMDSKEEATLDKFMSPDPAARAFVKRVYSNPHYLKKLEQFFPFLDRRGFLDIN